MNKTNFTPGPWCYRPEEPSVEAEHQNNTGFFLTVADCGKSRTIDIEEMKANARLIAAAPDLFAALEIAVATIERLATRHGPFSSSDGTLDVARAALAKAGGGL